MDSGIDSVKIGKQFFEEGKLDSALIYFETILQRDSTLFYVNKFAGITSLRLEKHDEAIKYFTRMEREKGLYQNPGMFYHAVALMHRNLPGDNEKARELLEVVVKNDLGEKEIAEKWLK
jgi:tetratricopeptide (TPR) repeat protein